MEHLTLDRLDETALDHALDVVRESCRRRYLNEDTEMFYQDANQFLDLFDMEIDQLLFSELVENNVIRIAFKHGVRLSPNYLDGLAERFNAYKANVATKYFLDDLTWFEMTVQNLMHDEHRSSRYDIVRKLRRLLERAMREYAYNRLVDLTDRTQLIAYAVAHNLKFTKCGVQVHD